MVIDYILPIAGIVCIILCMFFFFKGLNNSEKLMQEIRLEKLGVAFKLSSIPFMLLVSSLILISPTIYFRYYNFKDLAGQVEALRLDLQRRDTAIQNGRLLIREISNCTVPIYVQLETSDTDSLPILDNLSCDLDIGGGSKPVIITKGLFVNQYKILLQQIDCNTTIRQLRIMDSERRQCWIATGITPCEYVVQNLPMTKSNRIAQN